MPVILQISEVLKYCLVLYLIGTAFSFKPILFQNVSMYLIVFHNETNENHTIVLVKQKL